MKFSGNYLNLDVQITPFLKNKHFELCYFVMYRVRNIDNRRESDVIRHSIRRSQVPTSLIYKFTWCVRLSVRDATVSRFNPPAEPARTVGFSMAEPVLPVN